LGSKSIEPIQSKDFGNKEKTNVLIPKSFRLNRTKEVCSRASQEQRGANRGVPKLFRSKREETMTFQAFQE